MTHSKANRRADRFHFGFCNAFERSALESADQIRARLETVQDVAGYVSQDDCYAVMAGVHSALAAINGELDSALHTALEFGLSLEARNGLRDMILSGLADRALLKEAETVEKANRVNLKLVADYQLGAVGIGEVIKVRFSLPRSEVDQVWRNNVLVYDSGRKSVGLSE